MFWIDLYLEMPKKETKQIKAGNKPVYGRKQWKNSRKNFQYYFKKNKIQTFTARMR